MRDGEVVKIDKENYFINKWDVCYNLLFNLLLKLILGLWEMLGFGIIINYVSLGDIDGDVLR